ncbi:MAG TPA: hypothetical protein VNF71_06990 [Acidimicrobiales bacterium]|nr:hypothetical protein [Acidimicrobiales bacterium]
MTIQEARVPLRTPANETITVGELLDTIARATGLHAQILDPALADVRLYARTQTGDYVDHAYLDVAGVDDSGYLVFGLQGECGLAVVSVPSGSEGIVAILEDARNAYGTDEAS